MKQLLFVFLLALTVFAGVFYVNVTHKSEVVATPATLELPLATSTTPVIAKPFTILLVPGHDTNNGGAQYKDIYERDLVVLVAQRIETLLASSTNYKVIVARDTKAWNPIFADYFTTHRQEIIDFKNTKQNEERRLLSSGKLKYVPDMAIHSNVDATTSVQLYGINKWVNENDVDVVIHLHFNSSERPSVNSIGGYKGFTIFVPESQRAIATTSRMIAESVYQALKEKFTPETVGKKGETVIPDQGLIALGGSDTLQKPAFLIEYAYIYEKMLRTKSERLQALDSMALQTVAGIESYYNKIHEKI